MLVEKLLTQARERLVAISDSVPLIEAARLLRADIDIVVVCDPAGDLAGVITKTDVVRQLSDCQSASCMTPSASVMTRSVVTCRPEDWLHNVWATMRRRHLKNIPVLDSKSKPIGVLNARDALQMLLQESENEELLLRDYVMGIGYH